MGVEDISPPDPPAARGDLVRTNPAAGAGRVRRVREAGEDRWERAQPQEARGEQQEEGAAQPSADPAAEEEAEAEQEGRFDRTA